MREGSELLGGETGGQVYDYTEFGFGLFSIGTSGIKSTEMFRKGNMAEGLKEMFGASTGFLELKLPKEIGIEREESDK